MSQSHQPADFDIDVDVSSVLGEAAAPALVDARWYQAAQPHEGRCRDVQQDVEKSFRNVLLCAQWRAAARRRLDRRRALRVPMLSRVHIEGGGSMLACDISATGLRCSGRPAAPVMDVEFRLPKLDFPIDARVEIVRFIDAPIVPLVGARFSWIDPVYLEHIRRFIAARGPRHFRAAHPFGLLDRSQPLH